MSKFKVGDEVFVVYSGYQGEKSYTYLLEIKTITAKRGEIKLDDFATTFDSQGRAKRRRDRYSAWDRLPHIELATPELKAEVRAKNKRNKMLNALSDFDWEKLDQTELELVHAIVEKHKDDSSEEK